MAFINSGGHLFLTDPDAAGHIVWATDRKAVQLIPSAQIVLNGVSVSFPDLVKRNAYWFSYGGVVSSEVCDSFATFIGQEWGPGLANNLAATTLGTVPSGTDYLDVRAKVSRTVAPSQILGTNLDVMLNQGQWTNLPGGACPLESVGYFSRGFDVVLSGTTVSLRRFQTVQQLASPFFTWTTGNAEFDGAGGKVIGWTHGSGQGAAAPGADSQYGIPVARLVTKGAGGSIGKNRSGGNSCSCTDTTNFGATYSVDFVITPGRYA